MKVNNMIIHLDETIEYVEEILLHNKHHHI